MKRILLDQNVPRKLLRSLVPHRVETAFGRGWASLTNGALIAAAEAAGFDALITADQNLGYQENLSKHRIAIIVLDTNRWPYIAKRIPLISAAIDAATDGSFQTVGCF